MLRIARKQDRGQKQDTRSIKPCTFRQSGQLTGEQLAALNRLHEGFARNLSQSLAAYLRVNFEVNLVSVEQMAYKQVLERMPEITYMICLRVEPMSAPAILQIDHSVIFPLIDILLGGAGQCNVLTREVSEIEEHILEVVPKIICQELEEAWTVLGVKLNLDGRQLPAQMQRLLPPSEKTLCASFEIKLAEATGMLNLILPASISNTLLRKLSIDASSEKARPTDRAREQISEKMLGCSFPVDLAITAIKLPITTIAGLTSQNVCNLGIPVREPASLVIVGRAAFEATPVRHGRLRAAQLGQAIPSSSDERKP